MKRRRSNADLFALLEHEGGKLLYDGAEGSVVINADGSTVMTDITDGADAKRVLQGLALCGIESVVVKSEAACKAVQALYRLTGSQLCSQWVYEGTAPELYDVPILPLKPEHAEQAASHYGLLENSIGYITERIAAGRMWGVFGDAALAGFIGVHSEGSMGMLEVLPDYRRRGYGMALERFLIAWQVSQGWTPFGHVVEGNEASIHLQQKAGLVRASLPAIWVF